MRRSRVQKAQASIKIETDSDVDDDDSWQKRLRISDSEGSSRDISEAPTLVEDAGTNTSSPERTAEDEELDELFEVMVLGTGTVIVNQDREMMLAMRDHK
jgi:hypothetical protein